MSSLVGLALTPSGGVCEIAFKSDRSLSDAADVPCMSGFDAPASFVACRSTYWPFNSAEALHEAQLRDVQSSFSRFEDLPCLQSYTRNIAWHCIMVQNNCAVLINFVARSYCCNVSGNLPASVSFACVKPIQITAASTLYTYWSSSVVATFIDYTFIFCLCSAV